MASCHQEHNNVYAGVESRFCFESFSVPDKNKAHRNLFGNDTHTHTAKAKANEKRCVFVPAAGLVPALLITEARAHEHVLVDPSAQAVNVRRHLVPGLHKGQNQFQSLGPVSGAIPPDVASIFPLGFSQISASMNRIDDETNQMRVKSEKKRLPV